MRALFVAPVEYGSGETITAVHMAQDLVRRGGQAHFLATGFARRFVDEHFPGRVEELTGSGAQNVRLWDSAVEAVRPDVIVFADYPLLYFSTGVAPLVREADWAERLKDTRTSLVTLDHTGFAQRPIGLFAGPAHLSVHFEEFPAIPETMHVLLPCPMHEPTSLPGRRGTPFRYWEVPLGTPVERRDEVRQAYVQRGRRYLLFHAVPRWAWAAAEIHRLPYFSFLPEILDEHLGELAREVVLVSVNNGKLLPRSMGSRIEVVNLPPQPLAEYEALMFSSDLMITENKISISMGKAVCALLPCAALKNGYTLRELQNRLSGRLRDIVLAMERRTIGSVYPYEVFPSGMVEELDELRLYRENSLTTCFAELEIYGGEATSRMLRELLSALPARDAIRSRQQHYAERVRALPPPAQVLRSIVAEDRGRR
jgi:hypothetical protein